MDLQTRQERRDERKRKERTRMRVHGKRYVSTVLSVTAAKARKERA